MAESEQRRVERENGERNAVAWLALTDDELVERSASLGLPGDLHPDRSEPTGRKATRKQIATAREAADANARLHASEKFVTGWIAENRVDEDDE